MSDYARIRVLGKAGEDPVLKKAGDKDFVRLSIGCNDIEYRGKAEWVKAIFWGKLAEVAVNHIAKGSQIEIHGIPHLHVWQDQQGRTFQELQVRVKEVYFISTPKRPSGYNPDEKL
jgi:single stranded DNA-binding protein